MTVLTELEDDAYEPGGPLSGQRRPTVADMTPKAALHHIGNIVGAQGPATDAQFQMMIVAVLATGLVTGPDLARRMNVSLPTIDRWARGVSSPHPLMRSSVTAQVVALGKELGRSG
jgi:hypothetical protein